MLSGVQMWANMKDIFKRKHFQCDVSLLVNTLHDMAQLKPRNYFVRERTDSDGQLCFFPTKPVSWDDYPHSVMIRIGQMRLLLKKI